MTVPESLLSLCFEMLCHNMNRAVAVVGPQILEGGLISYLLLNGQVGSR